MIGTSIYEMDSKLATIVYIFHSATFIPQIIQYLITALQHCKLFQKIKLQLFYELGDEELTFDFIKGTTTAAGAGCLVTFSCEDSSMVSTTVNLSSSCPGESNELLRFKSSKAELLFCIGEVVSLLGPTPGIVGMLLLLLFDEWDAETITVAG